MGQSPSLIFATWMQGHCRIICANRLPGGAMIDAPFFPIIYVRGYAMNAAERTETTSDPFCGFNAGSTVYRSAINRRDPPQKFVFESPFVRLAADFDYSSVYENGADILDGDWEPRLGRKGIPTRSLIIYRYYDSGGTLLGDGSAREIEEYATGLSRLILRIRDLVCQFDETLDSTDFKCHLVAHSMGGLVVRAFLQNRRLGDDAARMCVDKIFTYATPHNGIEMLGINVPAWLTPNEVDTFNHKRMAEFLDLAPVYKKFNRVDFIHESTFPIDNLFCMVGTNRSDYEAAAGLSRAFVGHGSDGLVKIENASLWGLDDKNNITHPAATSFAYRSHSGYFGIVNSEEAYQNLTRFLFGDVRVDIWIEVEKVTLPEEIENDSVAALYQFELLARARAKRWYLSRRTSEEDSPACRTHEQLTDPAQAAARFVYLSTVFLANRAKVSKNPSDRTLAYSMDLRVRAPDYTKDNKFWPDQHYEGSFLFRDSLIVSLEPPLTAGGEWDIKMGWGSKSVGETTRRLKAKDIADGKVRLEIPLPGQPAKPGIAGKAVLIASAWNAKWMQKAH